VWGQENKLWVFDNGDGTYSAVGLGNSVAYRTSYNPNAESLFLRMSPRPDDERKALISSTIDDLQTYNLWDSLDVFYMFAANSAYNGLLNWKGRYSNAEAFNSDFRVDTGFFSTGTNEYINTNYNAFTFNGSYQLNNAGYYTYLWDNPSVGTSAAFVGVGDGVSNISAQLNRSLLWRFNFINDNTSNSISGLGGADGNYSYGMFSVSRFSDTAYLGFENYNVSDTISANTTSIPNQNIYLQAFNDSGTPSSYKNADFRFFAAGASFDSVENDILQNIVSSYLSGVGDIPLTNSQPFQTTYIDYLESGFIPYRPDLRIIAQRGNISLLTDDDSTVFISENNGKWYARKITIPNTNKLSTAIIFDNGKIVLSAIDHRMWVSSNNFETFTTTNIKRSDGTDYPYHTPVNPTYPGDYLFSLQKNYYEIGGEWICVFGNYTNVYEGASPVNIYYMRESDNHVYIAYEFGQNLSYRDDGSPSGGLTGNLLGDANNDSLFTRHIHSMAYLASQDEYYICTGDVASQIMWLKGTNVGNNWQFEQIIRGDTSACRYKATFDIIGDTIILCSDCTADTDFGIFNIHYTELADTNNHVLKYDYGGIITMNGINNNEVMTSKNPEQRTVITSNDNGNTYNESTLSEFTFGQDFIYNLGIDDNGYWVLKQKDTHTGETVRIKIKQ
jgi:hypothetical protein